MTIIVGLDQYRHGFQECGLLRGQAVLALVDQLFHGDNHMVVLFLGLDGFDDNAIRQPGVFLGVDGQCSAHDFHAPFTYSLCVTMQRMNSTLRVKFISATIRYLLPPMSKTTCGATKSAVLNDCFTSAKLDQVARLATRYQWSRALRACGWRSQEDPNRLVADNVHPAPLPWSHNGTALSMTACCWKHSESCLMVSTCVGEPGESMSGGRIGNSTSDSGGRGIARMGKSPSP